MVTLVFLSAPESRSLLEIEEHLPELLPMSCYRMDLNG